MFIVASRHNTKHIVADDPPKANIYPYGRVCGAGMRLPHCQAYWRDRHADRLERPGGRLLIPQIGNRPPLASAGNRLLRGSGAGAAQLLTDFRLASGGGRDLSRPGALAAVNQRGIAATRPGREGGGWRLIPQIGNQPLASAGKRLLRCSGAGGAQLAFRLASPA